MSTEATNWATRARWAAAVARADAREAHRAGHYPISRWYLRPVADRLAAALAATQVRPVHLTLCGLGAAAGAAAVLLWRPELMPLAALLVLVQWFLDRADGQLARCQQTVSDWGAWLDGNVDELVDVGLHVTAAAVLARQVAAPWPWLLLVAFLAGKYLLVYGLALEKGHTAPVSQKGPAPCPFAEDFPWLRRAYHLPGNADVRVHLFVLALVTGCLAAELAVVAAYYNLRWAVRYGLVARRLGGVR